MESSRSHRSLPFGRRFEAMHRSRPAYDTRSADLLARREYQRSDVTCGSSPRTPPARNAGRRCNSFVWYAACTVQGSTTNGRRSDVGAASALDSASQGRSATASVAIGCWCMCVRRYKTALGGGCGRNQLTVSAVMSSACTNTKTRGYDRSVSPYGGTERPDKAMTTGIMLAARYRTCIAMVRARVGS